MKKEILILVVVCMLCSSCNGLSSNQDTLLPSDFPINSVEQRPIHLENREYTVAYCKRYGTQAQWKVDVAYLSENHILNVAQQIQLPSIFDPRANYGCPTGALLNPSAVIRQSDIRWNDESLLYGIGGGYIAEADYQTGRSHLLFEPHIYASYHHIKSITPSPDGQQVAFVGQYTPSANEVQNERFAPSIWVYTLGTESPVVYDIQRLLPGISSSLQWSSDGKRLAYLERIPGRGIRILSLDTQFVDTHEPPQLTEAVHDDFDVPPEASIAWLPGDEIILYVTGFQENDEETLWYLNLKNGKSEKIIEGGILHLANSPNGQFFSLVTLLPSGGHALEIYKLGRQIELYQQITFERGSVIYEPNWSPDSRFISFGMKSDNQFDLFTYDLVEDQINQITDTADSDEISMMWEPSR